MLSQKYSILRDPKTKDTLHIDLRENYAPMLVNAKTEKQFPIENGIIKMLDAADVTGKNKRYQDLYDGFAWLYNIAQHIVGFLFRTNGKDNPFHPYMQSLNFTPTSKVLEVSIGTGMNMEFIPETATVYGVDISLGMLTNCRKCKYPHNPILIHGMAEELPFADNSFDVVFHLGGINFFSDKARAITEMIRVAKPGARILLADETETAAKAGEKMFLARRFFKNRDEVIVPPVDLIPKEMQNIKCEYTSKNDELWVITFTKPSATN